ncbi:MAG: sodium:proton exchanger [Propionibacterium sp.]|nr:sodium:proton exchanger [Propionibacterium sp.]
MSTFALLLVTVGVLGVGIVAVSARMRQWPLSEPLIALIAGVVLGPAVTGVIALPNIMDDPAMLYDPAEILLAISVVGVALRYPFSALRAQGRRLIIMLVIVMPVMALVSTGLAMGILGLSFGAALLLGTAVCPTDPVLSSSVVTGEAAERTLPEDDRQLLSLESGANDGLAFPLVLIAIAFVGPLTAADAGAEIAWQLLGALLVGAVTGFVAAKALRLGEEHGATEDGPILLYTILLALLVLGLAVLLNTNGVVGAFVAGLVFNLFSSGKDRRTEVQIDEVVNQFAVLPFFVVLGVMLPWAEWQRLGWAGIGLAVAVLLLRRVPAVFALMRPLHLRMPDGAYLGWFGPVGVAAVLYLVLAAERLGTDLDARVLSVGTLIVVASTVAHGFSSAPGRAIYRTLDRAHPVSRDTGSRS